MRCAYTLDFYWEKCDRKTAEVSKLELPGIYRHASKGQDCKKRKYTSDRSHTRFLTVHAPHQVPSTFMMNFIKGTLIFLRTSLKNWEEPVQSFNTDITLMWK